MTLRGALTVCVIVLSIVSAGCAQQNEADAGIDVSWQVDPDPPAVGPVVVSVTLADKSGAPVEGADVRIEGVMTHPGMAPSIADGRETEPGTYQASIDLTMRGDWILLLNAELPNGDTIERQTNLRVVQ